MRDRRSLVLAAAQTRLRNSSLCPSGGRRLDATALRGRKCTPYESRCKRLAAAERRRRDNRTCTLHGRDDETHQSSETQGMKTSRKRSREDSGNLLHENMPARKQIASDEAFARKIAREEEAERLERLRRIAQEDERFARSLANEQL